MAKPDMDDGWFPMAIELEMALAYAGFSKVARVLLGYVFIQIYGRGERPRLAYLPQGTTGKRTGQKRQNVERALRELVESGVLVEERDDQYRFVKDYEKWLAWNRAEGPSREPRLSPREVADCKDTPRYADAFRTPKTSSNGMTPSTKPNGSLSSNGMTTVIQRDDTLSSNGMTTVIQRDDRSAGAIEERTRVREIREKEKGREGGEEPPRRIPLSGEQAPADDVERLTRELQEAWKLDQGKRGTR